MYSTYRNNVITLSSVFNEGGEKEITIALGGNKHQAGSTHPLYTTTLILRLPSN